MIKTLGLTLGTALVLSAMLASAATAQTINGQLTSDGPVTLTATETNTGNPLNDSLTAFDDHVICPGSTYTGHKYNETPHKFLTGLLMKTITVTPHFKPCETEAPLPATVDVNGCDFVLHMGGKIGEHLYKVTTDLVCPTPTTHIQVTVFTSSSHALRVCTLTVTSFTDREGLHVKHDTAGDDIQLTGVLENIVIHKSGICGTDTEENGLLDVDLTVKGLSEAKGNTEVTVTDTVT